jgi:hypothetical protein
VGRFEPLDLDPSDLRTPDPLYDMDVAGTMAVFANGVDGVLRVSIAEPDTPRPLDSFAGGDARSVAFDGEYVYVVSGEFAQDVVVFPIDGSGGVTLQWRDGSPDVSHIEESEGYAYLSGHDYIGIIDATDPSDPEMVWEWEPPDNTGNPANTFVDGDRGYFSAGWDGLYIFDLSDKTAPAMLGHWPSPNWIIDLVVEDGIAYITMGNTGLAAVDVGDPASPSMLGVTELNGFSSPVGVADGYAFVGWFGEDSAFGGIDVVDVTDPENPVLVDSFGRLQSINGLAVSGNHLFIADEVDGLIAYEITGLD